MNRVVGLPIALEIATIASATSIALVISRLGGDGSTGVGAVAWFSLLFVVVGMLGGARPGLGIGVLLLASCSLWAIEGYSIGAQVLLGGLFSLLCLSTLVLGDLAFLARRSTVLAAEAVGPFGGAYFAAVVLGVGLAVALTVSVSAVEWPRWLLTASVVGGAALALVLFWVAGRYRKELNLAPQAAPPTGAPLPPPGSRPMPVPPPPRPSDRVGHVPPPPAPRRSS